MSRIEDSSNNYTIQNLICQRGSVDSEGNQGVEEIQKQGSHTPTCEFLLILKTLITLLRYVWLGLELHCAGTGPSRTEFGEPCPKSKQNNY